MSRSAKLACVVPVYNEEAVLERAIRMLVLELKKYAPHPLVVIASNGSTDATNEIGARLEQELAPDVRLLICKRKGRGWALREAIGDIVRVLVNDCKENGWYLDTELVVLAHRRGLHFAEVPIHWIEQRFDRRHSKVSMVSDTVRFMLALREIWLRRRGCQKFDRYL
jgi:glycosyltransferase involved in cell wall biosynthesis